LKLFIVVWTSNKFSSSEAASEYQTAVTETEELTGGLSLGKSFSFLLFLMIILRMFGGGGRDGGFMSRRNTEASWASNLPSG